MTQCIKDTKKQVTLKLEINFMYIVYSRAP